MHNSVASGAFVDSDGGYVSSDDGSVYFGDDSLDSRTETSQLWNNFMEWLLSEDSTYWVSGKPGSGKSTLVQYLARDPRTTKALSQWSTDCIILSHFFFKPGEDMQRTVKGMWSSLLHQLVTTSRNALRELIALDPRFGVTSKEHNSDWSATSLKECFYEISNGKTMCIFLDGLDEISHTDGIVKLLRTIEDLKACSKVKLCLASRREPVLVYQLNRYQQLELHDLTRHDMRLLIRAELQPLRTRWALSM
jgi:Cdc6-like AAA superfamily ATPase